MINTLQMECSNSMNILYDNIKGKKIDTSLLSKTIFPQLPPQSIWGLVDIVGDMGGLITTDLVYREESLDGRYKYTIIISIKNRLVLESCNSNPIIDCMCTYTSSLDIIDGYISYDVPYDILYSAINKLNFISIIPPIVIPENISVYEKIAIGLIIVISGAYIFHTYFKKK